MRNKTNKNKPSNSKSSNNKHQNHINYINSNQRRNHINYIYHINRNEHSKHISLINHKHHQRLIEMHVNLLPLLHCLIIAMKITYISIHPNQHLNKHMLVNLQHRLHKYLLLLYLRIKVLHTFIPRIDLRLPCKHQKMESVDHLKISISKHTNKKGKKRLEYVDSFFSPLFL